MVRFDSGNQRIIIMKSNNLPHFLLLSLQSPLLLAPLSPLMSDPLIGFLLSAGAEGQSKRMEQAGGADRRQSGNFWCPST